MCCVLGGGTGALWDLWDWSIDMHGYTDGLVQDCDISITNALELQQFCTEPCLYNDE